MQKYSMKHVLVPALLVAACGLLIVFVTLRKKDELGPEARSIVHRAKKLADEYKNVKKEDLMKHEGFKSYEKDGGYGEHIELYDKSSKQLKRFRFILDSVDTVTCEDQEGYGFSLLLDEDGGIVQFSEIRSGTPHGIYADFHENGKLRCLFHTQGGKLVGQARWWDESGKLLESVVYKEPQDITIWTPPSMERAPAKREGKEAEAGSSGDVARVEELAKKLADKYRNATKQELIRHEDFADRVKKTGGAESFILYDKGKKQKETFEFTDGHLYAVVLEDDGGDQLCISFDLEGRLSRFIEHLAAKSFVTTADFFANGRLKSIVDTKDGKRVGRAMWWDEAGRILKSTDYREEQVPSPDGGSAKTSTQPDDRKN